jgi:hypothetical protein
VEIRRAPLRRTLTSWFLSGDAFVHPARALTNGDCLMLDVVLLVIGCGFFVAAILYTVGCDRI